MAALIVAAGVTGCKSSQNAVPKENTVQKENTVRKESAAQKEEAKEEEMIFSYALPSVIIYKTKADYSKNVPVGLNEGKTAIISYPGKTDLRNQEPIPLSFGFLLDKRGVNPNSAFLKYTYAEFLALEAIPSMPELFKAVLDADPFAEMYDCGKISKFNNGDLVEQLNQALEESNGNPEAIYKRLK
jgi:hypothetical protein